MLIPLHDLILRHRLAITGVLHVGAHQCEERDAYHQAGVSDSNIYWVEGNTSLVQNIQQTQPGVKILDAVISDQDGTRVDFIITNNGQSSSILELETHKTEHPSVWEIARQPKTTTRLDTLIKDSIGVGAFSASRVNFINLDIQGAELLALKGLGSFLDSVQYVYTEVNTKHLYKNCALLSELDTFLGNAGFLRVDTVMTQHGWGDALYVKKDTI